MATIRDTREQPQADNEHRNWNTKGTQESGNRLAAALRKVTPRRRARPGCLRGEYPAGAGPSTNRPRHCSRHSARRTRRCAQTSCKLHGRNIARCRGGSYCHQRFGIMATRRQGMRSTPTGEHVVVETRRARSVASGAGIRPLFSASRSPSRRTVIYGSSHLCRRNRGAGFGMHVDTGLHRNARRWQR
jgi:hypothetical protein